MAAYRKREMPLGGIGAKYESLLLGEAMKYFFAIFIILLLFFYNTNAQSKKMKGQVQIAYITKDFSEKSLDDTNWKKAKAVSINSYWSGSPAPDGRHFKARLLWSDAALYVRFEATQKEPLIVSDKPDLTKKTKGLWDRDVCEIFIAPNKAEVNRYYEFEIAPTGEWIDLGIEVTPKERLTNWDYNSNMTSSVHIEKDRVIMAIKIPFKSLGKTPKVGDVWLGNLFRCVGKDPTRGYLAWQPTMTEEASFHVPSKFGEFEFTK